MATMPALAPEGFPRAAPSTGDRVAPSTGDSGFDPALAAPRAVVAWPPRRRDRVLGIPVGLLVCWELAALCVLAGFGRSKEQTFILWFSAAAVFGVSVLRLGRRWSYEWVALWWRHRGLSRRIRAAARAADHPARAGVGPGEWALLRAVASAECVTGVTLPASRRRGGAGDGEPAAVIEHAGGLSAVVEVAGLSADMLYLPLNLLPPFDPDGPEFALQALLHVRAAPPVDWAGGTLLVLVARHDPAFPSQRLREALTAAHGKLLDRLRGQGYRASPVGVEQTAQMMRVLTMLDVAPRPQDAPGALRWTRWRAGGVHHETVCVRSWSAPLPDLVRSALTAMPAGMTMALAARRAHRYSGYPGIGENDRAVAAELHIRVSELDARRLSASTKALRRALRATGAKVSGLDGRQGPGFAATLPLGGFMQ